MKIRPPITGTSLRRKRRLCLPAENIHLRKPGSGLLPDLSDRLDPSRVNASAFSESSTLPQLWLISVGYLFVALNIVVNGIELLLPTCFGYALITAGAWGLRDAQRVFRYVPIPAVILAVLSFPDLFRFSMPHHLHGFEHWIFWPRIAFEIVLFGMVTWGIWYEVDLRCHARLKALVVAAAPVLVASMAGWWYYPVTSPSTLTIKILIYDIPAFYLAAVSGMAAKACD